VSYGAYDGCCRLGDLTLKGHGRDQTLKGHNGELAFILLWGGSPFSSLRNRFA